MKIKILIQTLMLLCITWAFTSCEDVHTLSLTGEEFEATIQGDWKLVRASETTYLDKDHIDRPDPAYEIPSAIDYININGGTLTFYFKQPTSIEFRTPEGSVYQEMDVYECPFNGSGLAYFYIECNDDDGDGINQEHFMNNEALYSGDEPETHYTPITISLYGKNDTDADGMIISSHTGFEIHYEFTRK